MTYVCVRSPTLVRKLINQRVDELITGTCYWPMARATSPYGVEFEIKDGTNNKVKVVEKVILRRNKIPIYTDDPYSNVKIELTLLSKSKSTITSWNVYTPKTF